MHPNMLMYGVVKLMFNMMRYFISIINLIFNFNIIKLLLKINFKSNFSEFTNVLSF